MPAYTLAILALSSMYAGVVTSLLVSSTMQSEVSQFWCVAPSFSNSAAVSLSLPMVNVGLCSPRVMATRAGAIQIAPIGFFGGVKCFHFGGNGFVNISGAALKGKGAEVFGNPKAAGDYQSVEIANLQMANVLNITPERCGQTRQGCFCWLSKAHWSGD